MPIFRIPIVVNNVFQYGGMIDCVTQQQLVAYRGDGDRN